MPFPNRDVPCNRFGHRKIETADEAAHSLSYGHAKRVRTEHSDDRRIVEATHHRPLQYKTKPSNNKRSGQHADGGRDTETVDEIRDVSAKQDKLALSKVEDSHHAGNNAKTKDDQHHDRSKAQHLEECVYQAVHYQVLSSVRCRLTPRHKTLFHKNFRHLAAAAIA